MNVPWDILHKTDVKIFDSSKNMTGPPLLKIEQIVQIVVLSPTPLGLSKF